MSINPKTRAWMRRIPVAESRSSRCSFLSLHQALENRKYRLPFSSKRRGKTGTRRALDAGVA